MDKINELKQIITDIEAEASQLDPTKDGYYESLYNLLSVAYFASKDIIVLQEGNVAVVEDKGLEASLHDTEGQLAVANVSIETLQTEVDETKKVIIELQSKIVNVLKIVS